MVRDKKNKIKIKLKKLGGREEGGKIVILSTLAAFTQVPNHKTSKKKKKHDITNNTVNKLLDWESYEKKYKMFANPVNE